MASRTYNPETPWQGRSYRKHGKNKTVRELREEAALSGLLGLPIALCSCDQDECEICFPLGPPDSNAA